MKRHFNYTNRKRIPRESVEILLKSQVEKPPTFDAKLRLDDLKVLPAAKVYVEAYFRSSYMRFDYGTVEHVACEQDRTLTEIDNRDLIYFRVKIVDPTGDHGKLLAELDGITSTPAEGPGTRLGILEVKFTDLESQSWTLELEGTVPTLVVNKRIADNKEYVRSDETFFSLVYPAVVREILTRAVLIDEYDDWDTNSDEWQSMWIGFVSMLPGVDTLPKGDDNLQKIEWIERAVRAFCSTQPACERFIQTRSGEATQ